MIIALKVIPEARRSVRSLIVFPRQNSASLHHELTPAVSDEGIGDPKAFTLSLLAAILATMVSADMWTGPSDSMGQTIIYGALYLVIRFDVSPTGGKLTRRLDAGFFLETFFHKILNICFL